MRNGKIVKVLYVDDEEALLEIGKIFLERTMELQLDTADSAEKGINMLLYGKYDIIISDYQMPDMDGIQFLKYVNANFQEKIPFIIFTGRGREEVAIEALNNGASFYIQKGGDLKSQFAELANAIKYAYARKRLENKFKTIHEISMELSLEGNSQISSMRMVVKGIREVIDAAAIGIFFRDEGDNNLHPYLLEGFKNDVFEHIVIHEGEGLGGLISSTGKGYIINDYFSSDKINHVFDEQMEEEGFISVMGVPIRIKDESLGVLYVFSRKMETFIPDDLDTLFLFGNLAAMETMRRRRERTVIKERNHYIDFINSLKEVVFEADSEGKIILVNDFGPEHFGYSPGDIIGKSLIDFIHPDERGRAMERMSRILNGECKASEGNYRVMRADGTYFPGIISSSAISDRSGIRGLIIDNTKQENLTHQIVDINKKLNLISRITNHDVNNHLTAIRCCIDVLKEGGPHGSCLRSLEMIQGMVEKISSELRNAKIYQDIGINSPEWVSLGSVFDELAPLYPELHFINRINSLRIRIDPMFKMAMHNLIDNTIRHGKTAKKVVLFWQEEDDGSLSIIYQDDGVGIEDSVKELIFDQGFGNNTGLGLFLIREILSMTGMAISEEGEPGKGARFRIIVPLGSYEFR
jgi:PAS domain S-box-containing protein